MRIADRYEVVSEIGRGAFAAVYLATDVTNGEPVAVKWMLAPDDPTYHREIARLALLDGPGIARLRDHGRWEGREYLVLDYVAGEPFPAGPVPWARLEPLAVSLLAALTRIHQRGVIHGDIRPENALVDGNRVTLLDFGSLDGVRRGLWVAPEVFTGAPSTAMSDVFSAALLIAAASSGIPPWHPTEAAIERASGRSPRISLDDVPPQVAESLRAALTAARPTLDELAAAFSAATSFPSRVEPWTRDDLEALFVGAEPIVHLRTRPAALLIAATEGRPEDVAAMLSRWERSGRIRRVGSRFRASREGLDEEEADLEIAGIAGGGARAIYDAAERAIEQGRVHRGTFLLRAAALAARSVEDGAIERLSLEALTERAAYRTDPSLAEREIAASKAKHPDLEGLVRALRSLQNNDAPRALTEASLIPEPESVFLGAAIQATRFVAATSMGTDMARFIVDEARAWADRRGTPYAQARADGWSAQLAYRVGAFEQAAELHLRSMSHRARASERLSAQINGAASWVEAHAYPAAIREAEAALAFAISVGHRTYETYAIRVLRQARYRANAYLEPAEELVEACDEVDPHLAGLSLLVEAAGAWRRGDLHLAGTIAAVAAARCAAGGNASAALLGRALVAVCQGAGDEADVESMYVAVRHERIPAVALQATALLAAAGVRRRADLRDRWAPLADDPRILDVLSIREARMILHERWGF